MQNDVLTHRSQEQALFKKFVDTEVVPYADQYDREERIPPELVKKIADQGYLGALVPPEYGGGGMNMVTFGALCEELGKGSLSVESLLTVHGMVIQSILKWGSPEQREYWLPKLAAGAVIGAFGLTEPDVGSDAKSVQSSAVRETGSYVLNGRKKWITFGQVADLFLIIAQCEGKPTAFLVERNTPGLSTHPITGLLGFRAAMLAEIHLDNCRIPATHLVGRTGFGFSHVVGTALDYGRYCVGWGCVGLAQACLEACLQYTSERKQGGAYLRTYQLIQQMIAEMITNIRAARLLCLHAGVMKDAGDPDSIMETSIAKYFASRMVNRIASDAVQIHGANGCGNEYAIQRYFRDSRIMEIIEGSTQIQQIIISKSGYIQNMRERIRPAEEQVNL